MSKNKKINYNSIFLFYSGHLPVLGSTDQHSELIIIKNQSITAAAIVIAKSKYLRHSSL